MGVGHIRNIVCRKNPLSKSWLLSSYYRKHEMGIKIVRNRVIAKIVREYISFSAISIVFHAIVRHLSVCETKKRMSHP